MGLLVKSSSEVQNPLYPVEEILHNKGEREMVFQEANSLLLQILAEQNPYVGWEMAYHWLGLMIKAGRVLPEWRLTPSQIMVGLANSLDKAYGENVPTLEPTYTEYIGEKLPSFEGVDMEPCRPLILDGFDGALDLPESKPIPSRIRFQRWLNNPETRSVYSERQRQWVANRMDEIQQEFPDEPYQGFYFEESISWVPLDRECPPVKEPRSVANAGLVPWKLAHEIFIRDEYKCVECGSQTFLSVDHIIPWTRGGDNRTSNLQTLCRSCNSRKSNVLWGDTNSSGQP